MSEQSNLKKLRQIVTEQLEETLAEIGRQQSHASMTSGNRFYAATYLLREAKEYVAGAWDLLIEEKPSVSLSVSRWIFEAALDLIWAASDTDQVADRLRLLARETFRKDKILFEGLADCYTGARAALVKRQADGAMKLFEELTHHGDKTALASLKTRIDPMTEVLVPEGHPDLYSLYRRCCAAAHPRFPFKWNPDGALVAQSAPDNTPIAIWMAAAATFWLLQSIYRLIGSDSVESLEQRWKDQITPLLDD